MRYEFQNITVCRNGKRLLYVDHLLVEKDRPCIISGPSGSGKTTLLKLFNGMIIPDSGSILRSGAALQVQHILDLRRKTPIILQEPVLFSGSVRNNLEFPFMIKRWHRKISLNEMEETLAHVELNANILHQNTETLSGGEKQRVAIARALLLNPDVLLMDEPTSALDEPAAERIIQTLVNTHPHLSIIMVTHAALIMKMFDHHIQLREGEIQN